MAVILGRPDSARARPSSLIKKDDDYSSVFSEHFPIGVYTTIAELIRRVDAILKNRVEIKPRDRTNLRFFALYWVAAVLAHKVRPQPRDVARIEAKKIADGVIEEAIEEIGRLYEDLGGMTKSRRVQSSVKRW